VTLTVIAVTFLSEMTHTVAHIITIKTNYSVPRTRTTFGDRAFSVVGPVVWISLLAAVPEAESLYSSKRKLKAHLFAFCFTD